MARPRKVKELEQPEADIKAAYEKLTNVQASKKEVTTMAGGFVVDLEGVSTSNVIDEGEYRVTFSKATLRKARTSSNMTLNVELTINDPDHSELNGRKLFTNYTLIPASFFALKRDLLAFGADPEEIEGKFDVMEKAQELYGNAVMAIVTQEPDQNDPEVMRNRIRVKPLDD